MRINDKNENKMKNHQAKAYLLTMLVIIFWASSASAFKIGLRFVSPPTLLLYSVLVSTLALLLVIALRGQGALALPRSKRAVLHAACLGLLNPFLYYLILFQAYDLLPGQIAMALNYGWPLVLTLLSVPLLKQKLSSSQLFALIICFIGAAIVATGGRLLAFGNLNPLGVLLALTSTVIWAAYWLLSAREESDPVIKLFRGFCFGLCFILLSSPLTGALMLPPVRALPALIYIGFFEMGFTFVLWLTALQISSSAARISILIYITPFFSLLLLYLVIGERIEPATLFGLLLIVGGIFLQNLSRFFAKS
jgi:drug/metabolite transporter (DMT)-like permease